MISTERKIIKELKYCQENKIPMSYGKCVITKDMYLYINSFKFHKLTSYAMAAKLLQYYF